MTSDEVKDSEVKFWKYKWKTFREISQTDVFYLIWYYWEVACWSKCFNWSNIIRWIDELISEAWHSVMDEKPAEELKEISFWKYKWKTFESVFERDRKYFLWLYESSKDREKPNKSVVFTMTSILKKNDCIYYSTKKWLEYCKCCKTFHNIK